MTPQIPSAAASNRVFMLLKNENAKNMLTVLVKKLGIKSSAPPGLQRNYG
jgi:hypothetical protein